MQGMWFIGVRMCPYSQPSGAVQSARGMPTERGACTHVGSRESGEKGAVRKRAASSCWVRVTCMIWCTKRLLRAYDARRLVIKHAMRGVRGKAAHM
jgi:hypothetical protein